MSYNQHFAQQNRRRREANQNWPPPFGLQGEEVMNPENALVKNEPELLPARELTPTVPTQRSIMTMNAVQLTRLRDLADMLTRVGFTYSKIGGQAEIFTIMLKGYELGLEPMASLEFIEAIQNKLALKPVGMLALIQRSGELEDMTVKLDNGAYTVMMKRRGQTPHSETFGKKEAEAMGLLGKDNYRKQPETMYKWRAVGACARVVFPDILGGLYPTTDLVIDEVVNEEGEIIDASKSELATEESPSNYNPAQDKPATPKKQATPKADDSKSASVNKRGLLHGAIAQAGIYDHENHRIASINGMFDSGSLTDDMELREMISHVIAHRAYADLALSDSDIVKRLGGRMISDYLSIDGNDAKLAWALLNELDDVTF